MIIPAPLLLIDLPDDAPGAAALAAHLLVPRKKTANVAPRPTNAAPRAPGETSFTQAEGIVGALPGQKRRNPMKAGRFQVKGNPARTASLEATTAPAVNPFSPTRPSASATSPSPRSRAIWTG